ncbi:MAG: hypothetical protein JOY55_21145 [Mycobacterium sp.]|nr:hypothetical protein [Mycobacterium sp.]
MTAHPDRLRLGDVVRFAAKMYEVVGFDGGAALLRTEQGHTSVVRIAALLGDESFAVLNSGHRRRPLVPSYFDSLPQGVRDRALWLESHVSEVLDGVPIGSALGTTPRPGYDVICTNIASARVGESGRASGV